MSEALNVGQFVLVDREDGQPDTYTSPAANILGNLGALGEAFGGVLGDVVKTMGRIIGGALELGVGVFKWVVDGILDFSKAIGEWLAYVFAPNPEAVFPTYFSPIKADLEGIAAPIIDRIKTEHARVDASLEKIEALRGDQVKLREETVKLSAEQAALTDALLALNEDMDDAVANLTAVSAGISQKLGVLEKNTAAATSKIDAYAVKVDQMGPKVTALETANTNVNKRVDALDQAKLELVEMFTALETADNNVGSSIWSMTAFTTKMNERLATFKTQMVNDLNVAGQINQKISEYNTTLGTRLKAGGDIANQIKTAADNAATAGAKGFNDWWAANGQQFINMQSWYTNWNNGQWDIQKEINDLQTNWNAKVMAVLDAQVKTNSQQTTFNQFVVNFAEMQKQYNDTNTGLWRVQRDYNNKNSELWQYQRDYNNKNSHLWAYQNELNRENSALWQLQKAINQDNVDLWAFQKWYNSKNDALWTMQKAWNNTQTGWNATQEKINTNRTEWEEAQESLNAEYQTTLESLQTAQEEILKLQEETFEFIPRRIVAKSTTADTENTHFRINRTKTTVTALGTWIGEGAIRSYGTVDRSVSISTPNGGGSDKIEVPTSNEQAISIPQLQSNGTYTRSWTLPAKTHTVAIDYWIYRGTPKQDRANGASHTLPIAPPSTNGGWTNLSTFTIRDSVNHRILYNLQWAGATYGDRYGVRILLNGAVLASKGPNIRVGPMTSLGDGRRWMNIPEISQSFKAGDVLTFQAYFEKRETRGGTYETERTIRQWNRTVAWIEPPKEG